MNTLQNKPDFKKILLTGGHGATTGIAVIEEIKKRHPDCEISWIGSKNIISGSKVTSLEYKIYPTLGVKYYSIKAGKMQTKFTLYTIPLLFLIPIGFVQSLILILKIKPQITLSFGGYASLPVVFCSWLFAIPVIVHEQTLAAGRSTMISTFFAKKIALARSESVSYFPKNKVVLTGNPVMRSILNVKMKIKDAEPKTILIMGGSRGSEFINLEIKKILPDLIRDYRIVHITGEKDFEKYKDSRLPNYTVLPFVNPFEMANYYEMSDLIISRSGANTVSEILCVKRPSILIPLPKTFMDEQLKNADFARNVGIAQVIRESNVDSAKLIKAIKEAFANWPRTRSILSSYQSPDINASEKLIDLVEEYK